MCVATKTARQQGGVVVDTVHNKVHIATCKKKQKKHVTVNKMSHLAIIKKKLLNLLILVN